MVVAMAFADSGPRSRSLGILADIEASGYRLRQHRRKGCLWTEIANEDLAYLFNSLAAVLGTENSPDTRELWPFFFSSFSLGTSFSAGVFEHHWDALVVKMCCCFRGPGTRVYKRAKLRAWIRSFLQEHRVLFYVTTNQISGVDSFYLKKNLQYTRTTCGTDNGTAANKLLPLNMPSLAGISPYW
jgi:hypothetical protein